MSKISALLIGLLACGCGYSDESLSSVRSAVVGGSPADDDPGVVLVVVPGGVVCTGAAISERVVLTAKHCSQTGAASEWRVLVGTAPLQVATRDAEYLVAEIRETPGGTGVGEDLAIMLLDSDFEYKTYRYAFEGHSSVAVGAPVRHVGFGNTVAGDNSSAGSRNTRSGNITDVYSGSLNATVGACPGDSGGPLFNADDVVLGVAHDILSSNCEGEARFTRLEPWANLIDTALSDTNGCVPVAWEDPCGDGVDNDCNGTVDDGCVPVDAGTDAGDDAGAGDPGDSGAEDGDAGTDAGTDAGADAGADTGADSGTDSGNGDYTGGVKGGCSTGGGEPGLALLVLVILALRRSRVRRSSPETHRSR